MTVLMPPSPIDGGAATATTTPAAANVTASPRITRITLQQVISETSVRSAPL